MPIFNGDYSKLITLLKKSYQKNCFQQSECIHIEKEILEEFIGELELFPISGRTYLIAIAIHKNPEKNVATKISCIGIPVNACSYDCVSDSYGVNCLDYLNIGYIPIAFKLSVSGIRQWESFIPIPENVFLKYLSSSQKLDLEKFRGAYCGEEIYIEFLQMLT
jgi:hypothetical protein